MPKVGVLTIGQSPRKDATPSIQKILGEHVEIVERGGLDRLTQDELHLIAPDPAEKVYISKLRNGESVKIGKTKLLPLLQEELSQLEEEVDVILMLCTGDFPTLQTKKPILYPDKILTHVTQAILSRDSTLGLIIPLEEQRHSLKEKWGDSGIDLEVEVASPYEESDIHGAAKRLKVKGAHMIILDCMGYNDEQQQEAKKASGLPVMLSRSLAARVAQEYLC